MKDRHHQVNGHGNPDLSLHRIGTRSMVMLDSPMTFDPAKEQLDAPAQTIDMGHGKSRVIEMIG